MADFTLLNDILIIFGLAIIVILIFHKLKIPSVIGFLMTGIIAGPYGFGLVGSLHEVETMAEIGVILLLFTIGVEFSLKSLLKIKKAVFIGGSLQVVLTVFIVALLSYSIKIPINQSIFIGFLIALSSTAIVLKVLQDKGEINSQYGRNSLAILIFQDIIIVPMILLTPLLAGETGGGKDLIIVLGKGVIIILFAILLARYFIPNLLFQITKTRSRELFLLSVITICFGIAGLTAWAGLSLALGAFLAGLIISESEYSYQTIGHILPFKEIFTSFFFVSIGMLLNIEFFLSKPLIIILLVLGVIAIKTIILGFVSFVSGYPLKTNLLVGLALSQIGEFSFVLSKIGLSHQVLSNDIYQTILAVAIISMGITPFIMMLSPKIIGLAMKLPIPKKILTGLNPIDEIDIVGLKHHLIIIGYGTNGKNVAKAASHAGIHYIIIEMNPQTVRELSAEGENIIFGDATQEPVLEHACIKDAMVVVIAIPEHAATRRITELVHRLNPSAHMIVRTRELMERDELHKLGAQEVIPAEFETSVEIFSRVLTKYLVPKDEIDKLVRDIRNDEYEMLRSLSAKPISSSKFKCNTTDLEFTAQRVCKNSILIGKSISEIEWNHKENIRIIGVKREGQLFTENEVNFSFKDQDILILMGNAEELSKISAQFGNSF